MHLGDQSLWISCGCRHSWAGCSRRRRRPHGGLAAPRAAGRPRRAGRRRPAHGGGPRAAARAQGEALPLGRARRGPGRHARGLRGARRGDAL